MNAIRVLFLTLVFALSMLFLVQNTQVLDTRASLVLDLWWVKLSSPEIAFYVFIFLCLILGIVFGALTFLPGNRDLREDLRLLRVKIKRLTQEVIDMQKKEDISHEKPEAAQDQTSPKEEAESVPEPEKSQEPEAPEDAHPAEKPPRMPEEPIKEDQVVRVGGAAGKAALVGIFALFILLTLFYYYVDQQLNDFQTRMDMAVESSNLASELATTAERDSAELREEVSGLAMSLQQQEKEIIALKRLPQDTVDYLTLMFINQYAVNMEQLIEEAETDEDREMLSGVLDSLNSALKHYMQKNH